MYLALETRFWVFSVPLVRYRELTSATELTVHRGHLFRNDGMLAMMRLMATRTATMTMMTMAMTMAMTMMTVTAAVTMMMMKMLTTMMTMQVLAMMMIIFILMLMLMFILVLPLLPLVSYRGASMPSYNPPSS